MGIDAPDGTYLSGIPPQCGLLYDRATAAAMSRWGVVLITLRGGYAGGGAVDN